MRVWESVLASPYSTSLRFWKLPHPVMKFIQSSFAGCVNKQPGFGPICAANSDIAAVECVIMRVLCSMLLCRMSAKLCSCI